MSTHRALLSGMPIFEHTLQSLKVILAKEPSDNIYIYSRNDKVATMTKWPPCYECSALHLCYLPIATSLSVQGTSYINGTHLYHNSHRNCLLCTQHVHFAQNRQLPDNLTHAHVHKAIMNGHIVTLGSMYLHQDIVEVDDRVQQPGNNNNACGLYRKFAI